jgi:hypothetical protein
MNDSDAKQRRKELESLALGVARFVLPGLLTALLVLALLFFEKLQTKLFPEFIAVAGVAIGCWAWALGETLSAKARRRGPRDVRPLAYFFLGVIWLGSYLVVRIGWSAAGDKLHLLFIVLMWGLCFLTMGGLLGFLFGIPRTLSGSTSDRAEATKAGPLRYQVNTNLERVSDWVTSIIVGGTVTQVALFPTYWHRLGEYFATGMGPSQNPGMWKVTGAAGAAFFFVAGFLGSYLLTRLYLAGAIQRADGASERKVARMSDLSTEELRHLEATCLQYGDAPTVFTQAAADAATEVRSISLDELTYWRDIRVWAKAQLAEGDAEKAGEGYLKALDIVPNDAELRLGYAIVLGEQNAEQTLVLDQLELARDSLMPASPPDLRKNVFKSVMHAQLFLKRPESFTSVLKSARDYFAPSCIEPEAPFDSQTSKVVPSAGLLFNIACAYGQAHRWLTEDPSRVLRAKDLEYRPSLSSGRPADANQAATADSLVERAVDVLKLAIERDDSYQKKLATMLNSSNPADDDFKSMSSSIRNLVEKGSS